MPSIASSDSGVQSGNKSLTTASGQPLWRALLHDRGLSDATIDHFRIHPDTAGWLYPVAPDVPTERWKAFPRPRGAKYRWQPRKPAGVTFYDPHGDLHERIAAQGGTLILAAGEPDVWALHEAGIANVTATLHGEGSLPGWLVEELHRLGVRCVQTWPDRDQAGVVGALKLRDALAGSGITLDLFALPYPSDSKADINSTLIDVGPEHLADVLHACPPLDLPSPEPFQAAPTPAAPRPIPESASTLYERWCLDVEAEAVRAWNIAPPNAKHLSRRNFSSPWREDRRPSAQWSYTAHGFKDYATGEFTNTHTVAALLGLTSWADTKAAHFAATQLRPSLDAPANQLRHFPQGVPGQLVALLLNLHGDTWLNVERGTLPNFGAAAATYVVWQELVRAGALADDEPVTAAKLANCSAGGRNLSKDTAANGLRKLAEFELIEFLSLPIGDQTWIGTKSRLIPKGGKKRGRKGDLYRLKPLGDALSGFLARLAPYLLACVLVRDYPDLPVSTGVLREALTGFGLTDEHLAAIDARCGPLYAASQSPRQQALQEYARRRGIFRVKYGFETLLSAEPLTLPAEASTPNAAAFRSAVDDTNMDENDGVREDRYAAARAVGRTLASHRHSCAQRDIIAVPQYAEFPLDPDGDDVLSQCAAVDLRAFQRGTMELVAPGGALVRVSARYADRFDYDDWAAHYAGEGAITIRVQRASIEKRRDRATPDELAACEASSEKQQTASRRRWMPKPTTTAEPAPKSLWPVAYLLRQGELRAGLFGVQALPDGRFVTPDGEVMPRDAVALWRSFAAVVDPAPEAPRSTARTGQGADHPHDYENHGHACVVCGEPAAALHWTGWYCAVHAALPLNQKRTYWQSGAGG